VAACAATPYRTYREDTMQTANPRIMLYYRQLQVGDVIRVPHQDGTDGWTDTTVMSVKTDSRETEVLTGAWPVKLYRGNEYPVEIMHGDRLVTTFCVNCRDTGEHHVPIRSLIPPNLSASDIGVVILNPVYEKSGALERIKGLCPECTGRVDWVTKNKGEGK
jgi:hypothetical protein